MPASTVSVIDAVKAAIPEFKKAVPDDVDVRLEFDQSPYVRNSIRGLVLEGLPREPWNVAFEHERQTPDIALPSP